MITTNRLILSCISLALLGSCSGIAPKFYDRKDTEINDPTLNLTREDYRNLPFAAPKKNDGPGGEYTGFETVVSAGAAEPPIPAIAPILSAPKPPQLGETRLVSISVTSDVPLRDVLLELARLANVDIEVDANIQGGVDFRATQKPFNEVIERLADFAGLRYRMQNGVLRVERDEAFVQIYTLDFLNFERSASSNINVSTSVLSGASVGGEGGSGLSTGSSTSITTSSNNDFWMQFETGITQILAYTPQGRSSSASAIPVQSLDAMGVEGANNSEALADALGAAAPAPAAAASTTSATSTDSTEGGSTLFTINKQAGTLTVVGNQKQHRLVGEFIRTLEYNASAQVLIEAKIVEVTLNENFESGIDWSRFTAGGSSLSAAALFGGATDTANLATFNFEKRNLTGLDIDLTAAVELAQVFGTTRTLSSPRLHAINNQQAVMTFAENEVYFTIEVEKEDEESETGPDQTTITVNSTINTVPIGIIMTMLPSINRRTGEVTLNIRPTLSRVVDRVEDPALAISLALDPALSALNLKNLIPVVEVRELDSILKVKSGEVMVIGGLMEDRGIQSEKGVPGASDLPIFGNLFKGVDRQRETKELIIFVRATILDQHGGTQDADRNIYDKFTQDPRPLNF